MSLRRLVAPCTNPELRAGSISWNGSQVHWVIEEGRSRSPWCLQLWNTAVIHTVDLWPWWSWTQAGIIHQFLTSFGGFVLGYVHLEAADFYVHLLTGVWLTPKQSVEEERLIEHFRSGKSFCRKLCSGLSFLCTLLKCAGALMNEELWCWRELFQRLHLSHSVCRGAGDREKALRLAGSLSLTAAQQGDLWVTESAFMGWQSHGTAASLHGHFPSCP